MGSPRKKKYTVRVEWFDGDCMSQYQAHVLAINPEAAFKATKIEANAAIYEDYECIELTQDAVCLFVFRGHLNDEYGGE